MDQRAVKTESRPCRNGGLWSEKSRPARMTGAMSGKGHDEKDLLCFLTTTAVLYRIIKNLVGVRYLLGLNLIDLGLTVDRQERTYFGCYRLVSITGCDIVGGKGSVQHQEIENEADD